MYAEETRANVAQERAAAGATGRLLKLSGGLAAELTVIRAAKGLG